MADLNQSHPLLLRYLIQNAIWWIEFAGVDGFRVDTFPYNNPKPMVSWVKAIRNEYPDFNIVGEGWMHNSIHLSYWQEKSPIAAIQGFDSHLPSVMDFTLNDALVKAFNERNSYWEGGMTRIYKNLQNDFLYPNINNLLIFAENHDTNRINDFYPEFKSYQRLLTVLMTLRGIPQIYYGSEIGMTGKKSQGDGDIRRDFPGGWPEDSHNAFLSTERTEKETLYFDFTKKLLNWRKKTAAVHYGKTLHYVPQEDVYVYFRYLRKHRVMVVVNNNSKDQTLDLNRFEEGISGQTLAYEVLSDHHFTLGNSLEIPAETALIIELNEQ
jgi:glycosidase